MKDVRDMKTVRNPLDGATGELAASPEEAERGYQVLPDTDTTADTPRWKWQSGFLGRSGGFER